MSQQRILVSIDVTKIDKAKLVTGSKGIYLDLILIPTPENQYGSNYLIKQEFKREPNDKGVVIGNAKIIEPQEKKPIPF